MTSSRPGASPDETTAAERGRADAIRAALGRLGATLSGIAETADVSVRRRCPHRGVRSRCHYRATCRNQVRRGARVACGGDAFVRFDPVEADPAREQRSGTGRGESP